MFVSGLSKEKQEAFLNLAYTMMHVDDKIAEQEQKIFESYSSELTVDLNSAHKVDFEKELMAFDGSSDTEKNKVFFELYAIALIDEVFEEAEKELVDIMREKFNISDAKMKEMKEGLERLTLAYRHLDDIVKN